MVYFLTVGLHYQTKRLALSAKSRISARGRNNQGKPQLSTTTAKVALAQEGQGNVTKRQWGRLLEDKMQTRRKFFSIGGVVAGRIWTKKDGTNGNMPEGIWFNPKEFGYHYWSADIDRLKDNNNLKNRDQY